MADNHPVDSSASHDLESTKKQSQVEGEVVTKRNTAIIDNLFTDQELVPIESSSQEHPITTLSAAKRTRPLVVTDDFENGKRNRLSFEDNSYGPISADLTPPILASNGVSSAPSSPVPAPVLAAISSQGMFDDAEGDETFDIEEYKQLTNPPLITIRPDLVAAILGTPPKPRASGTGTLPIVTQPNIVVKIDKTGQDSKGQKRTINKKVKKKMGTEKERIAAAAILEGQIDLLRIIPRNDCNFMSTECFIFTLQQLEWVLDDDLPDVSSRQKTREMMTQKLKGSHLIATDKSEVIKEDKTLQAAEKIKCWKYLIKTWKEDNATIPDEEQFPLDGPLSCLFPTGTLQFMKSVNVKTAIDFLCLKKSESGLVIEMFRAWRKICGLKEISLNSLAKHLTGISARIETSLKCEQIAERNDTMKWMAGAMVVLTGAARDFAVDHSKIFSATHFLEARTKTLADNLADWRAKSGLSELKGSGTVAMISSWKAQLKDELKAETSEGEVLPEQEIRKETETTMPPSEKQSAGVDEQKKRKKTKIEKSKTNFSSPEDIKKGGNGHVKKIGDNNRTPKDEKRGGISTKKSVRSPKSNSINPFDALSKPSQTFLAVMNISTGSQFLEARTTDIANAYIKYREDNGVPPLKGFGAVASISGWKKLVRNKAVLVGDLKLAHLNESRNTKVVDAGTPVKPKKKKLGKTIESRFGELDALVAKASSKEFKAKHSFFSVLSTRRNVHFYFELIVRQCQSGGYKRYLRYLGNDPASISVDPTVETNTQTKDVHVPIIVDPDEKSDKMSGRQPYDSLTFGTIELGNLDVQPPKQDDDHGTTLEEVIKVFVLQNKGSCGRTDDLMPSEESLPSTEGIAKSYIPYPPPTNADIRSKQPQKEDVESSRNTFNMFKVLHDSKQRYILCEVDPIEKGQSVELSLLPFDVFDKSWLSEESGNKVRAWIQDQLVKLPAQILLDLLEFLEREVAADLSRRFESVFKGVDLPPKDAEDTSSCSSMTTVELVLARRRIHWVTVKVLENLQTISGGFDRNISTDLLWTKAFVRKLLDHSCWNLAISETIKKEIAQEIQYELSYRGFNGFASTLDLWCPIAKKLFDFTVDLFVGFSGGLESFSSEANLITELCSMVSQCISDLRISSNDSRNHEMCDLLKLVALVYKEGVRHNSKVLPSFEEVTQNLNSIKDLQIVVIDQSSGGSNGKQATRFQHLEDTKICETANIDVRWYVDRQILAVVQTAIRCGMATFVLENEKDFLGNIEAKILEAVRIAVGETEIQFLSLENFEIHRSERLLQSVSNDYDDRSSPAPSAGPIFLGFVWPLLKAEGWRLAAGGLPSDTSYIPPVENKSQKHLRHHKNLFARQRSQLARDSCSFGLGYIPKLTKRLLIQCLEREEEIPLKNKLDCNGKSVDTSTNAVMEAFASSLLSKLNKTDTPTTNEIELQKTQGVVSELLSLFNEVVPLTFSNEDNCKLAEGKQWSDILDCRYLLKVLIIMPSILKDADLPIQQYQHTISVIHELLYFLSQNQQDFFGNYFRLPNEEYLSESKFPSCLLSQIINAIMGDTNLEEHKSSQSLLDEDASIEVILPTDRDNLTDFVVGVLSQTIIGNATLDDVNRQGRSITGVGHPCIICRHCLGVKGGKYCYSSFESLCSAATTIEKHILRCPEIDNDVKQDIIKTRVYHPEQRKKLPSGAQSDFYKRLYMKLQQSTIRPPNESLYKYDTNRTISNTTLAKNEVSVKNLSFRSHIDVMKYIQSNEPWKSTKSLVEMVDMYYICLEYGGKLYNTNGSSVDTFSSEWLYSKLAPEQN